MLDAATLDRMADEIETSGFAVVPDVISAAEAERMRSELLAAVEEDDRRYGGLPGKKRELIQNLPVHDGSFVDLLDNATMHAVFSRFLTDHCILYNYSSTILFPDAASDVQNIHVDSPRVIPGYHDGLIMTLALDDFTEENGATQYLPGSFALAERPDVETFDRGAVSVARPRGAAVFFNPRSYHRGGRNRSTGIRCGVTVFAVRPFMKQRFDYPRMIRPESLSGKPPRVARFLGFDARVPASMEEFYTDPDRRLYKAGQE